MTDLKIKKIMERVILKKIKIESTLILTRNIATPVSIVRYIQPCRIRAVVFFYDFCPV